MKKLITLVILSLTLSVTFAAFPVKKKTTEKATVTTTDATVKSNLKNVLNEEEDVQFDKTIIAENLKSSMNSKGEDTSIWGILSFVFGIIGLVFIPPLMGLFAIVFGAIGLNKSLKGLAITGLVLGILEVLIIFLVFALILAVL